MKRLARLGFLVVLLFVGLFTRPASAHLGAEPPRITGRARPELPREGPRGRLEIVGTGNGPIVRLVPGRAEATGTFQIKNVGEGLLEVYRVGFEREEGAPRAPAGVGISSPDRETKPLQPGEVRTYTVSWRWDESRAQQLFGYLAVETDSAAPGATAYDPTQVVPLVADRRPSHLRFILTVAALAPLLATLLALLARSRLHERRLAQVGAGLAALSALVACVPLASFARRLSREDGAWGLQHVERARLFGDVEYFVGVDGLSAPLLPLAAVVLFAAAAFARPGTPSAASLLGWGGLMASATTFFVVSQSLALSGAALCVAVVAAIGLAWSAARPAQRGAALQVALALGVSAIAFVVLIVLVRAQSFPSRLSDGTLVQRTLALPELAREVAHGHVASGGARLLGMPFDRGAVTLLVLVLAGLGAYAPFHGWAPAVMRLGGSAATMLFGGTAILSGVALSRFATALYPEATRGCSLLFFVLGLATVALAGLRALISTDLRDLVGRLVIATGGLALFSLATATPAGIQGHLAITLTRALALPLAALTVSALAERTGDTTVHKSGGLALATPWLAATWVLALAAAALVPGSGGFRGALLAVLGAAGRAPWLAFAMVAALALTVAAALRGLRAVMGPTPAWWKTSAHLEPNGGAPPDLRRDDLPWALVLAALLVALAVAPRLWLELSDATIMDVYRSAEPQGPTQVF